MIVYALMRHDSDGYTYSCDSLEGIFGTEDAALAAWVEADKANPPDQEGGDRSIQPWDTDTGKEHVLIAPSEVKK